MRESTDTLIQPIFSSMLPSKVDWTEPHRCLLWRLVHTYSVPDQQIHQRDFKIELGCCVLHSAHRRHDFSFFSSTCRLSVDLIHDKLSTEFLHLVTPHLGVMPVSFPGTCRRRVYAMCFYTTWFGLTCATFSPLFSNCLCIHGMFAPC